MGFASSSVEPNCSTVVNVPQDHPLPPGVYRSDDAPVRQTADAEIPLKPDFKDFIALTLAAYSIIMPFVLTVIGGVIVVFLLLSLYFR
jgi:hypothetical protein